MGRGIVATTQRRWLLLLAAPLVVASLMARESGAGTAARNSPPVTILQPAQGATVSGVVTLRAAVPRGQRLRYLQFSVDGRILRRDASPPFETRWNTEEVPPGMHRVEVTAVRASGGRLRDTVTVFVDPLSAHDLPVPRSDVVQGIEWAPASEIRRAAEGSDNWPLTWADDGAQYTAFGDGWGFAAPGPGKLSLGYARITGSPTDFAGENIPSPSGERLGHGETGQKASGMLMVDGILYQWVRNAGGDGRGCQLAWSNDHARHWTWAEWRFEDLGYCTFLNFGRNYEGARDGYVYTYSPASTSAYLEADELLLLRGPVDRMQDRDSYEYYAGPGGDGRPAWTPDVSGRHPVLSLEGAVNRLSVTYSPGIKRYLMTMRSRAMAGGRNQFSLYEAAEPWGPWKVVYYTETWEGSPLSAETLHWGEAQHIPAKWLDEDGRGFYLVFSGDDAFSVRRARLYVARGATTAASGR